MPAPLILSRRHFVTTLAAASAALALPEFAYSLGGSVGALAGSGARLAHVTLQSDWKDAGILSTAHTPQARLRSVPVHAVALGPGFWSKRRTTNVAASIPSMREQLLEHGRMDNFLRLVGKSTAPQLGPVYSDSDIYKWIEAVAFVLQSDPGAGIGDEARTMIAAVVAAQEPNGYLNTYFQGPHQPARMLPATQTGGHELYCLGHMLQAGIAWYRATGESTLLDAGIRFVDEFLIPHYGPSADQTPIVAGHPEIEMSLIELYRTTGERRYLDLAGYILAGDSRVLLKPEQIRYMFCGVPFTTRTKLEGHAVRAMYACCGATDYYLETGDPHYLATLETLWNDLSLHQLYVTGGVGARSDGEAFGDPYELPNATAYGESCAAIGNMMWNWRMLTATGDAKYADVIERALYNGINSGMSLDGKLYCYRNPLAFDPSTGDTIRNPWYDTTCCPPNLERVFASLPGYFYSASSEGLYVHLYDDSALRWHLASGTQVSLTQSTRYPWEGTVHLRVTLASPEEFTLFLRIPAWSEKNTATVNGQPVAATQGSYLAIRRRWITGDEVTLSFDMTPGILHANPAVADDRGRVALQRGPLVYCMEQLDQSDELDQKDRAAKATDPVAFPRYVARLDADTAAAFTPELLDGVVVLSHGGALLPAAGSHLYETGPLPDHAGHIPVTLRMIPYYAWCNRAATAMQVWTPYVPT